MQAYKQRKEDNNSINLKAIVRYAVSNIIYEQFSLWEVKQMAALDWQQLSNFLTTLKLFVQLKKYVIVHNGICTT